MMIVAECSDGANSPLPHRTLALPHRTQILYLPDIAFITSYLDVKPGSQIIEAGSFLSPSPVPPYSAYELPFHRAQEPVLARSRTPSPEQSARQDRFTASSTTRSGSRKPSASFLPYLLFLRGAD
jgi:hypothetical protein